jgi:predicted nucleic acid-binding protein
MSYIYELNLIYNNEEKLKNRKSIFLDTNIWIDLVEKDNSDVKECKELLINLTEEEKIFCPLSIDTFIEFHKQYYDSASKISEFIDKVSLNLSMINYNKLYLLEIRNYLRNIIDDKIISISKNDIFVPYACTTSNKLNVQFPHSFKEPITKAFFRAYHNKLINWKFSEYLSHFKEIIPQKQEFGDFDFQKEFIERSRITKGDKKKMKAREEESLYREIIKPILIKEILNFSHGEINNIKDFLMSFSKEQEVKDSKFINDILSKSPALKNTLEIMTFVGYDLKRKSKKSDICDYDIMIYSMSYCDVLFTRDGWIFEQLNRNYKSLLTNTKIVNDFKSLNEYLKKEIIFN